MMYTSSIVELTINVETSEEATTMESSIRSTSPLFGRGMGICAALGCTWGITTES
jgi:hypothetical protein